MKMITLKENIKNIKEFNELYDAVKWGSYSDNISQKALNNSFYTVSVYDDDKIVGFGRLIGDEICFIYIQDVMVKPEYQNKKIGTMIMNNLLDKVNDILKENPDARVYLGSSLGKEDFYKKFGFVTRKEAGLGEGMIYDRH